MDLNRNSHEANDHVTPAAGTAGTIGTKYDGADTSAQGVRPVSPANRSRRPSVLRVGDERRLRWSAGQRLSLPFASAAARPASRRATGIRKGEQET